MIKIEWKTHLLGLYNHSIKYLVLIWYGIIYENNINISPWTLGVGADFACGLDGFGFSLLLNDNYLSVSGSFVGYGVGFSSGFDFCWTF